MSGLPGLLLQMGHKVSGSDRVTSGEVERLKALGLQFSSPHTAEAVEGVDAVVYSSAIRPTNPARAAAEAAFRLASRKILIVSAHVSNGFKEVPAILQPVVVVDRNNLLETVVADGFHTKEDLQ